MLAAFTWPGFLPRAVQSFTSRPIQVADLVTISIGSRSKRYRVTAVHDNGEADITAEDALPNCTTCDVCGQPMPEGEEMFRYHGYSGPCPSEAK